MDRVKADPVGCAKGAARAVRARMLGTPRGQNRATPERGLSVATVDFAHPTNLVAELNTRDLQPTRRGAAMPWSISHPETPSVSCRLLAVRAAGAGWFFFGSCSRARP